MLDLIPDGPSNDREFINKAFSVVFSDGYIKKLMKNGADRQNVLDQLRGKKRHATIKGEKEIINQYNSNVHGCII